MNKRSFLFYTKLTGVFFLFLINSFFTKIASPPTIKLALLKYNGGGDWYANPTSLTNLTKYCNEQLGTNLDDDYATVEVGSAETQQVHSNYD